MARNTARERLEAALARIDDPKGEGARTCLTVYREQAKAAADAADARAKSGISLGPVDGTIVSIKDLVRRRRRSDARRARGFSPTNGSRPRPTAPVVRSACRAGGAIVVPQNEHELNLPTPASAPIRISARPAIRPTASAFPAARPVGVRRSRPQTACARSPLAPTPAARRRIPCRDLCGIVGLQADAGSASRLDGAFPSVVLASTSIGPMAQHRGRSLPPRPMPSWRLKISRSSSSRSWPAFASASCTGDSAGESRRDRVEAFRRGGRSIAQSRCASV